MLALAHLAQLMKRAFKLKASSAERCGTATGKIVLFQYQYAPALLGEVCRCAQTAVSGADNYNVVACFCHRIPLSRYILWLDHKIII